MRIARTISISLEPRYERRLQAVARRTGGVSSAVRFLLDALERGERERTLEEAYRAFYADAAARESSELNQALLAQASWSPQEQGVTRGKRSQRGSPG